VSAGDGVHPDQIRRRRSLVPQPEVGRGVGQVEGGLVRGRLVLRLDAGLQVGQRHVDLVGRQR
jgi:hypothetical protein